MLFWSKFSGLSLFVSAHIAIRWTPRISKTARRVGPTMSFRLLEWAWRRDSGPAGWSVAAARLEYKRERHEGRACLAHAQLLHREQGPSLWVSLSRIVSGRSRHSCVWRRRMALWNCSRLPGRRSICPRGPACFCGYVQLGSHRKPKPEYRLHDTYWLGDAAYLRGYWLLCRTTHQESCHCRCSTRASAKPQPSSSNSLGRESWGSGHPDSSRCNLGRIAATWCPARLSSELLSLKRLRCKPIALTKKISTRYTFFQDSKHHRSIYGIHLKWKISASALDLRQAEWQGFGRRTHHLTHGNKTGHELGNKASGRGTQSKVLMHRICFSDFGSILLLLLLPRGKILGLII